jgi:hypothetical protein
MTEIVARTKKNWTITTPGYRPFPMILLEEALDYGRALAFARSIWPRCDIN